MHFSQDLLTSSSRQFYSVTGYPINRVTIHLPPSWQHSPCSSSALSAPSLASALDVVVEDTPYSLPRGGQFGGCGTRGLSLSLPLSSINKNITKNTGKFLNIKGTEHVYLSDLSLEAFKVHHGALKHFIRVTIRKISSLIVNQTCYFIN